MVLGFVTYMKMKSVSLYEWIVLIIAYEVRVGYL